MRRQILVSLAIALLVPLFALGAPDGYRLGATVSPSFQSVDLTIDPSAAAYRGLTRINLRVVERVDKFRIHSEGIEISKMRLDGPGGAIPVKFETAPNQILVIKPARPLEPGNYGLRIDFSNEFNTRAVGLYKMVAAGSPYAFTQFEAIDARKAFPCFDEPSFKIPFQLRLTVPAGDEAVSNTPVVSVEPKGPVKTVTFARTRPLPTYLVAIAVGPMDSVPIPGLEVPGRVYTPKGQAKLATVAAASVAPIVREMERYFGMKYPYEKLDLIAIPEYWPGAMEHPGAVTFADTILLLDPATASADQRRTQAQVTAHELAHMWFGDLVTMQWWDDLWLNESFADWFGDKVTGRLYPQYRVDLAELRNVQSIMTSDGRPTAEAIRKPVTSDVDLLGDVDLAYDKGKTVIGMFERWIGPETFRRGVNDYLRAYAWGNASAADLWSVLSRDTNGTFTQAMSTFLDQPGLPLVEARIAEGGRVILSQRRFAAYGKEAKPQRWTIPVGLDYSDGTKISTTTVLLDADSKQVDLVPGGKLAWVMPNSDAAGYYRWSVDPESLLSLASSAPDNLSPRERVAFVGNLAALLDAGVIDGAQYLKALQSFARDPEPRVVSAVLDGLRKVRVAFVSDAVSPQFSAYVRQTLQPAVDRFGLEPRPGEDDVIALIRPELISWMGREGNDPAVIAFARERAAKYLADPSSVDDSIAGSALRVATAVSSDASMFDALTRRVGSASTPGERQNYIVALGAFRDPALQSRALSFALSGQLRPNEIFYIPFGLTSTSAGRDRLFEWATTNFDAISSRIPPLYLPYLTAIADGCEQARVDKARAFFSDPKHRVDGTDQQLEMTVAGVTECVALRQREGERVSEFLATTK